MRKCLRSTSSAEHSVLQCRWQLRDVATFDDNTGQTSGCERASVDVDPVRSKVGCLDGRVAVDNETFERVSAGKKLFESEQILLCLFTNGDAGPDPGMDKKGIATTIEGLERLQKVEMLFRQGVRKLIG